MSLEKGRIWPGMGLLPTGVEGDDVKKGISGEEEQAYLARITKICSLNPSTGARPLCGVASPEGGGGERGLSFAIS